MSRPSLVCLSEPQLFQCDANIVLSPLSPTFKYYLNSEDLFSRDLPLDKKKAWGGTLAVWHSALDPFVTVLPSSTPAILPLHLHIPGLNESLHLTVYLPTAGKDQEFCIELASLGDLINDLSESIIDI